MELLGTPPRMLVITGNKSLVIPLEVTLPSAMTEGLSQDELGALGVVLSTLEGTKTTLTKRPKTLAEGRIMIDLPDWGVVMLKGSGEGETNSAEVQQIIDQKVQEALKTSAEASAATIDKKVQEALEANATESAATIDELQEKIADLETTGAETQAANAARQKANDLVEHLSAATAAKEEATKAGEESAAEAVRLAKEQEEILLVRDMQSDAVQQLMRRLSTARLSAS
jgi:outer membrane lipopolysaccharide assembly protein LptE/RlpB